MLRQDMQGDNERSKLNYFIQFVWYYIASSSTYNTRTRIDLFNGDDGSHKVCAKNLQVLCSMKTENEWWLPYLLEHWWSAVGYLRYSQRILDSIID